MSEKLPDNICHCCGKNEKKGSSKRFCTNCSAYISAMIMKRSDAAEQRYKKVFQSLFEELADENFYNRPIETINRKLKDDDWKRSV